MEERGSPVTELELAAFEQRLGHRLPDDYRQFLREVNGGRPAVANCEFAEGVVADLLSLNDAEPSRALADCTDRAQQDLTTDEVIVIGYDEGGARILLGLVGAQRGQIWFHVPTDARPADANPRVRWHDRRDIRILADTFALFLASLRPLR